jgi:glyoxylase-like metal-dependent hydrolase (beta-lactamase superfamily II)
MAAKVREVSGARIGMHPAEADHVGRLTLPGAGERAADWLRARGAPAAEAAEIVERTTAATAWYGELAAPDVLIDDGSLPVRGLGLRAIWTPGHSPGHLCFYDEDHSLLLTGDHVLPRISPHIGLNDDGGDPDPLGRYLASLSTMTGYEPDQVLPAHEYRFTGLGERVAKLLTHHQGRLAEIEHAVACQPGASTWRVAELLTWSRGWEQTTGMTRRAAVSETLAHLVHLRGQHRVVNDRPDGPDGVDGVDAWLPGPRAAAGWD